MAGNGQRVAQRVGYVIGPVVFLVIFLWPIPPGAFEGAIRHMGVSAPAGIALMAQGLQTTIAMTSLMVIWWITEAVPIPVTALLPGVLLPVLNVHGFSHGAVRAFTSKTAFASYSHPVIYLFLAGFLLAIALSKHGLDRRLTLWLLTRKHIAGKPALVLAAMMAGTALVSMWVSNTASTAMMLPLAIGVGERLVAAGSESRVRTGLLLGVAWSASIGGMATVIGSPPNGIAVSLLQQQNIATIGFLDWSAIGLPLVAVLLPVAWVLLLVRFPFRARGEYAGVSRLFREEQGTLGPWSKAEKRTLIVFVVVVILWVSRPFWARILPAGAVRRLSGWDDYEIALLSAAAMFLIPAGTERGIRLLDWNDAKNIDWGTLILFGGGLALSTAMFQTGMAQWLTGIVVGFTSHPPMWLVIAAAALFLNFLTEITSNTAVTAMMVPILIAFAVQLGLTPVPLILAVTFSASMAFMLPVATPPNALVYGTGEISVGTMARNGFAMNLIGWFLVVMFILFMH